jgi:FlaA1/EpsC-like NDP-sugar epimerase
VSLSRLLKPTKLKRTVFFIMGDLSISLLTLYFAYQLRFNFDVPNTFMVNFYKVYAVLVIFKMAFFALFRLYSVPWQFFSLYEYQRLLFAHIFTYGAFVLVYLLFRDHFSPFARSIIIIDFFLSIIFIGFFRILKRLLMENPIKFNNSSAKRALIVGAGKTGERIARGLVSQSKYFPIGFVDDDLAKQGLYIHNIKVLGGIDNLEDILKKTYIDTLIIAIPALPHTKIKKIYETAKQYTNSVKIVPSINKLPDEHILVKDLRNINLEDLLARKAVNIDSERVELFFSKKVVFVSGACGSIGSEIIRQLIKFNPSKIIAYEIDETEIHNLALSLNKLLERLNKAIKIDYIVGDIKDEKKLNSIFVNNSVDIVFHAAAYKHVPLMEHFPEEAVKTNIFGSYSLARISKKYGVKKFINISTDKAVNPTSIMGATKRVSEMIGMLLNKEGETKFISVRFGNVLGSRGSVIPIFLEQIKNGGPVTVTHPDMKRYFMTIPEAVLLVFQAATMGAGGEVFVLDMGEPVKIIKLAEELISLQGLKPYKDIEIVFTGLRPGEKLFEELLSAEEGTDKTYHEKIYISKTKSSLSRKEIDEAVKEFSSAINSLDRDGLKRALKNYVPFYTGAK